MGRIGGERARVGVQAALLIAFFASGTTGLVYEIVWTRLASTWFGVSAYAISTTLAAFMGGLALGGVLAARWLRGRSGRQALRAYALAELGVAVSAVSLHLALVQARPLMVEIARVVPDLGPSSLAVRFAILALALLLPTTLIGATFPLLAHGLASGARAPRRAVDLAYGVNVLGATVGCAATAWGLLPGVGMLRAVLLAAVVNLFAGAVAWALSGAVPDRVEPEPTDGEGAPLPFAGIALPVGLSGATAMAGEVVWSRVFFFALGEHNPFRAFALVLTLVLAGMGLGAVGLASVEGRHRLDAVSRLRLFAAVQAGLALLTVVALADTQRFLWHALPGERLYVRVPALVTLAAFALLLGLGFPLLASIEARVRSRVGARVGALYSVSTIAGVGGSILAGFVLLPLLGSRVSLLTLGGLNAGAAALAWGMAGRRWRAAAPALIPGGVLLLAALLARDLPYFPYPGRLLYLDDGVETTAAVVELEDPPLRVLVSNGKSIEGRLSPGRASTPMSLSVSPVRVLLVGFGTGLTAQEILRIWPEVALDCVDLDDTQVDTVGWFGTESLLVDPRFTLVIEDGRQFVLRSDQRYDVIIVDSWGHAVNQEFYNADFYRDAATALDDDGIFYVKLPIDVLDSTTDVDVVLRSAAAGFPHAYLLPPVPGGGLFPGVVGTLRPLHLPPVEERRDVLPEELIATYEAARRGLFEIDAALVGRLRDGRINSDDQPWFFRDLPDHPTRRRQIEAHLTALRGLDPGRPGPPPPPH